MADAMADDMVDAMADVAAGRRCTSTTLLSPSDTGRRHQLCVWT